MSNNHFMYTNSYTISNSLKFDDIVKINSIIFMFWAMNNVLPNNLRLLYKAKSYNGNLFNRIKVRTDRKAFFYRILIQCCGRDYEQN